MRFIWKRIKKELLDSGDVRYDIWVCICDDPRISGRLEVISWPERPGIEFLAQVLLDGQTYFLLVIPEGTTTDGAKAHIEKEMTRAMKENR